MVLCPIVFTAQSLTCESETVEKIREEDIELHQECVDSQDEITLSCPSRQEEEIDSNKTYRAQENVGIHFEEIQHFNNFKQPFQRKVFAQTTIVFEQQSQ